VQVRASALAEMPHVPTADLAPGLSISQVKLAINIAAALSNNLMDIFLLGPYSSQYVQVMIATW
jgi:hypothetical protein